MSKRKVKLGREVALRELLPRASGRMLAFLEELYRFHGYAMDVHARGLPSVPARGAAIPMWFDWGDYVGLIRKLEELCGADGVSAAMRGISGNAYAEFRAQKGFFPNPDEFFAFYTHMIMPSITPGIAGTVRLHGGGRLTLRYDYHPDFPVSNAFNAGSATLIALMPTHFDLPEARVQIRSSGPFHLDVVADFPRCDARDPWGSYLRPNGSTSDDVSALTPREKQVLRLVTRGMTNREIAAELGTAPGTVRNQLSSIMTKMHAANRTELAVRAQTEGLDR